MVKPRFELDPLGEKEAFHSRLGVWFERDGQSHPWRDTTDPWAILVSESMLQQTTVAAVRAGKRFERFLAQFPTIQVIAEAPEEDLLKAWEGLGYYNRVRNLQKTAIAVLATWGGQFPRRADDLQSLPGVGPYTAGAIASFAFDVPAPIVDGNVARVFARLFDDESEVDSTEGRKQLWQWAHQLLDHEKPRVYNSALMEAGQVFCRPRNPDCLSCPIASFCRTSHPEDLPRKKAKRKVEAVNEHALVAVRQGKILLAQEEGSRRKGFYRLPLRSKEEVADLELLGTSKYAITRYSVTLALYRASFLPLESGKDGEDWYPLSELNDLPMPSPVRRALESVL